MKCPKCGFNTSRPATSCVKCGISFPEQPQLSIEPEPVLQANAAIPEWRKEVTRKAREFGERKKFLTTPPRPLKEQVNDPEPMVQRERTMPRVERSVPRVEPILPVVEVSTATIEPELPAANSEVFSPPLKTSPPPPVLRGSHPSRRIELDLEQILPPEIELESETTEEHPLYMGRRFAALLSDHVIMVGLIFAVIFFSHVLGHDLRTKFESFWLPMIGGVLLFHFLYYFYFHKTSRQTPGQVFLSLEIRNFSTGSIPTGKIVGRWAAMVFLNVFNLVPLFLGKNFLLLDYLSGTEVRSFKDKVQL